LNHSLRVFLVDSAGNIRNIYSSGTLDLRLVLADVKTLMLESAGKRGTRVPEAGPPQRTTKVRAGTVGKKAFTPDLSINNTTSE
jgi:hypothetical protein